MVDYQPRLEDPDGNEITISELIDNYLSNPELCFEVGRSWSHRMVDDQKTYPPESLRLKRNHNNVLSFCLYGQSYSHHIMKYLVDDRIRRTVV